MSLFENGLIVILLGFLLGFGFRYGTWVFDGVCEMLGDFARWLFDHVCKKD